MHPGSAPDPGNAPDPRQIRYLAGGGCHSGVVVYVTICGIHGGLQGKSDRIMLPPPHSGCRPL